MLIAVVHRNDVLGDAIALVLRDAGYAVDRGDAMEPRAPDLVFVGVEASRDGAGAVTKARRRWRDAAIVALVSPNWMHTPSFDTRLRMAGAAHTLASAFSAAELIAFVRDLQPNAQALCCAE